MSSSEKAVIFYLVLYVLYVLVPIIPAVIIFKLFPDSKVAVTGPLQNLSVNAGGAFAAYLVTVLLGYFLVKDTGALIADMVPTTWKVTATVVLQDSDKKPLTNQTSIASLGVDFQPRLFYPGRDQVHVTVPVERPGNWPTIVFDMKGFEQGVIDLKEKIDGKKVDINAAEREITLKEPVRLNALSAAFNSRPYQPSATPLQPLPPHSPATTPDN